LVGKKVFKINTKRIFNLIKKSSKRIINKTRQQKVKLKEYVIDHFLQYGELLKMEEVEGQVIFHIELNKKYANNEKELTLVFQNKEKEIVLSLPGSVSSVKNESAVYKFALKKDQVILPEEKKNYYLFISVQGKLFWVRFIDTFEEAHSISYFETDTHLFFARRDRHRRIFFRTGSLRDLDSMYDLPNFITSIKTEHNAVLVSGEILNKTFSQEFPDAEFFLTLRTANGVNLKAPMSINGYQYSSKIEIPEDRYLPKGKWNIFIMVVDVGFEKYFPCYVKRKHEENSQLELQIPGFKESLVLRTRVRNGKVLAKLSALPIKPDQFNIKFHAADQTYDIYLRFLKDQRIFAGSSNEIYLRLHQRDTNEFFDYKCKTDLKGDYISAESSISITQLTGGSVDSARRWDVYLGVKKFGKFYNHRIKNQQLSVINRATAAYFKGDDDHYFTMFYRTKYNGLSFVYSRIPLVKYVNDYRIDAGRLILEGITKLTYSKFNHEEIVVSLLLVNRLTEEAQVYKARRYGGKQKKKFSVEIPLNELDGLVNNFKEIIDFYLIMEGPNLYRKMKIGLKEFSYYKDDVQADYAVDTDSETVTEYYLTITPKGNLKLESFRYNRESYELIQSNADRASSKNVWLVGERPDTAQDNGLRFFEYIRKNHPEIDIYYVIEENAPDAEKLKSTGNVLFIGSDEHIEKSIEASKFIGTHDLDYILPFKGAKMKNYRESEKIFLQHGVLGRKNVPYHKKYYKYPFNIFIVSSEPEKNMVVNKFGYERKEVAATGLARFDKLQENHHPKREILLIPTWREWIVNEEKLMNSSYFNKYVSFITSERLAHILEKYDLKLNFYPHYRMQEYIADNVDINNDRIRLIKLGEIDVQSLIKDNILMITDYSSVSFDFTYLRKPVIYYHFDPDMFFSTGILRPIEETFLGDIVSNEEDLLNKIEGAALRDFRPLEIVEERFDWIFTVQDQNNNQRILDVILNGIEEDEASADNNGEI
jgi:CDP-glycerol glycerophosphotransferase (TagB/SpsB family)